MTRRYSILLVLTLAIAGSLAISAGTALGHGGGGGGKGELIGAAATYLGVTKAEIATAKKAGQTLAQLAVAKGKSVQGLTNALVAAGKAEINAKLAAGKITSAQAATKIAALPAQVDKLINSVGGSCSKDSSESGTSGFRGRHP